MPANADLERRDKNARNLFHRGGASIAFLGGADGAQKLHDLITDLGRGFVLNPVTHIVDFKIPHETRKARAEFLGGRIELTQAIRLARDVKGRLGDRSRPSRRQTDRNMVRRRDSNSEPP